MSNIMRWRYGETNPVTCSVHSDTAIENGDCVFKRYNTVWPARDFRFCEHDFPGGSETFRKRFVGVAMQHSPVDDEPQYKTIRVATTGFFEFPCTPGLLTAGDYVQLDVDVDDDDFFFNPQRVVKARDVSKSIGIVDKLPGNASTAIIKIASAIRAVDNRKETIAGIEEQIAKWAAALDTEPISQTEEAAKRIADVAVSASNASLASVLERIEKLESISNAFDNQELALNGILTRLHRVELRESELRKAVFNAASIIVSLVK